MSESDVLAAGFERNRARLRAVAYRMLGSFAEADDAVQEAWLRCSQADSSGIDNLGGWLTTITARVCLNMLRARRARHEQPFSVYVPDPVVSRADGTSLSPSPEDEALLADSVGLALQVVLDTLTPAERLAFVLHDLFDLPFGDIAPMVGRTPATTRQLASRARRRVRGADVRFPEPDLARQREVVDAFFAAAHRGDIDGLVAVLDPDVLLRSDGGAERPDLSVVVHGAEEVARRTAAVASRTGVKHPVLVNGAAGVVITLYGEPLAIMGFTVAAGKVVEINAIGDPERIRALVPAVFEPRSGRDSNPRAT